MGEEKTLLSKNKLSFECEDLKNYFREFFPYKEFKNAPFPRLEAETDLLIGTEGQLGVINEIEIETTKNCNTQYLFMLLPKWEENPQAHLEVIQKIQKFRKDIYLCELIDSNSFQYLAFNERPNKGRDAIFFEIKETFLETFIDDFLLSLSFFNEEDVFEISENKFHYLRASIPRAVFEENLKMGITKMGTDIQVQVKDFGKLLKLYHRFSLQGSKYNLFGHFGDAHLHFNFMPNEKEVLKCHKEFEYMYKEIKTWKASPFAEHGIGIIKQKYIASFWSPSIFSVFRALKKEYDPYNQFFPQGYMSLERAPGK